MEFLKDFLIKLLPYLLAFAVLYTFRNPISKSLLPRVESVKFGNLEITFLKNSIKEITSKRTQTTLSDEDASSPFDRGRGIAPILEGARILWIDDNPEHNNVEVNLLQKIGITVDTAITSAEAKKMLSRFNYDAVISDIKREGKDDEGSIFLKSLIGTRMFRYTVFYVGHFDKKLPIPEGAFNITNRPDKLLHFVMDMLERERWQKVS